MTRPNFLRKVNWLSVISWYRFLMERLLSRDATVSSSASSWRYWAPWWCEWWWWCELDSGESLSARCSRAPSELLTPMQNDTSCVGENSMLSPIPSIIECDNRLAVRSATEMLLLSLWSDVRGGEEGSSSSASLRCGNACESSSNRGSVSSRASPTNRTLIPSIFFSTEGIHWTTLFFFIMYLSREEKIVWRWGKLDKEQQTHSQKQKKILKKKLSVPRFGGHAFTSFLLLSFWYFQNMIMLCEQICIRITWPSTKSFSTTRWYNQKNSGQVRKEGKQCEG